MVVLWLPGEIGRKLRYGHFFSVSIREEDLESLMPAEWQGEKMRTVSPS